MKRYSLEDLHAGLIVGRPIYSNHGQLILEAGTELTDALIARLSFYGIYNVTIQDDTPATPNEPTPEPPKAVSVPEPAEEPKKEETYIAQTQSHSLKLQQDPAFQEKQINYTKEIVSVQSFMAGMLTNTTEQQDFDPVLSEFEDLAQRFSSAMDLFDMLHNMRQINDSIYAHSLNVALIAQTLGKWLNFSEDDLQVLTLCGLLHDVGKTALPIELLNKPGKYTPEEYAAVKQHPALGFQILQNQDIDIRIKRAVFMHHERCDGSGYPQGLKIDQLDDFAMIIAIADVYEAMTMARSYREPLCPFQVISAFEKEGLQKYHPKYILTFLEHIADTYQHNRVLLNSGQSGTIVMINKRHLTQPYIQLTDGSILDMTTRSDLEIVSIL